MSKPVSLTVYGFAEFDGYQSFRTEFDTEVQARQFLADFPNADYDLVIALPGARNTKNRRAIHRTETIRFVVCK